MQLLQILADIFKLARIDQLRVDKPIEHCAQALRGGGKQVCAEKDADLVFHVHRQISASRAAPTEINVSFIPPVVYRIQAT